MELSYKNSFEDDKSCNNDSGFMDLSIENSLLLTSNDEQNALSNLNNRLSNYIKHVHQLELQTKTNKTIEELIKIPSNQLENLKYVYDSEIKSLRDALDKQSNDMAKVTITNNKLLADVANYEHKLKTNSAEYDKLSESLLATEAENTKLKLQISLLQKQQESANGIAEQLKTCQAQLEVEVLLRTASDNACLTYKEKMEFNEAVFKKELGAIMLANKSIEKALNTFKNDIGTCNFLEQMEEARNQLRNYLNEFHNSIKDNFLNTISKAANFIGDNINNHSKGRETNDELIKTQTELIVELEKIKSSHIALENRLSDMDSLNEAEIDRLKRLILQLSDDKVDDLEKKFQEIKSFNKSLEDKLWLDTELSMYRKLLDSEKIRTDFENSTPATKRRKIDTRSSVNSRKILIPIRGVEKKCSIM